MATTESLTEARDDVVNKTLVKEVEFGMCTATCGTGFRVLLTNRCPGYESKCIILVEGCCGRVCYGCGQPISESLESVTLACIHIFTVNQFIICGNF